MSSNSRQKVYHQANGADHGPPPNNVQFAEIQKGPKKQVSNSVPKQVKNHKKSQALLAVPKPLDQEGCLNDQEQKMSKPQGITVKLNGEPISTIQTTLVQKEKTVSPNKSKKKLSSAKAVDKDALKKQELMQQTTGPTTTNLTLNMNFNMQQSSIQMNAKSYEVQSNKQSSARQQYRVTETDDTNQEQSSHRNKYDSSCNERSPSKKKQHKKQKSHADQQLRELTKQESTPQIGAQSASPSKVKKVKVPKTMIDKTNVRGTNTQSQHQFVIQELSANPLQQQLQMQQQQLNANPMSPNHHGQQLPFNYRLRVAQIEKETSKNSTATQLNVQSTRRGQVQDQFSNGSNSRLGDSDAKLNRKNERPTVAQILDLNHADTQWMDSQENVPRRKEHRSIQPKSQVVSAGEHQTQPVLSRNNVQTNIQSAQFFNATSNFEQMQNYLGTMTQPQSVKQNKMKGASQLFLQENISLQHRSPNSQQTKLLNPLKNRQFGVQSEVYQPNFDTRLVSPESHRNSQLRNHAPQGRTQQTSTFATPQGRSLHGNAVAHQYIQSSQGQFQHQQQQYLAPYYIDYSALSPHSRFNQQLRDTHNIQLPPADYSRINRLQHGNEEEYHQVGGGDFPLISVTSSQLASLITQAANNRQILDQRQQIQDRNMHSQTKQSLQQPISPQAAFRYDGTRISNPLSLTIQINERDRQFHTESGQQVNNAGIFLPSLQQQMNTTLQQTNNFSRQMNQNIVSQQQMITSPAPVTKMRLCSRGGKSVPRGSARTDPEPLIERQSAYRNKQNFKNQQAHGQGNTS